MTTFSQRSAVIDLTLDDDAIYISSNEASDTRTSKAPSAVASGTSTPTNKKRRRRKKGKALSAVIAEHVKESFSIPASTEGGSTFTKDQTYVEDEGTIEEVIDNVRGQVSQVPNQPTPTLSKRKRKSSSIHFEVDTTKGDVATVNAWDVVQPDTAFRSKNEIRLELSSGLLLPSHATVVGEGSAEIEKILAEADASFADEDPNEESFVDYRDDDRTFRRYWEAEENEDERKRSIICAKCGEEGHRMKTCTAVICEKCGVRDEHLTRSCPMSKKCFTCGMTGHINRDCPNRHSRQYGVGCERCGSGKHVSLECPSLWRVYEYLSDRGRQEVCEARAATAELPLLEGGAAYIAADEWCYFCGESGHLGDDCPDSKYAPYRPEEPSAFGIYNLQTGPFSDVQYGSGSRGRRQWEEDRSRAEEFASDRGRDPGRKGREKRMKGERERARRRDLEEEEVDEEDDWFGRRRRENRHEGDHRKREHGSGKRPQKSLLMRMQIPEEVKQPGRELGRKRGRTGPQYHGGYTRPFKAYLFPLIARIISYPIATLAASTLSRRTDEDLLNRSLLDSIEAESLSERVEPMSARDVSSSQAFPYPLSPQSPHSLNPLPFNDMFINTHNDFIPQPHSNGRTPTTGYSNFSLDQRPHRSATLPLPQSYQDQRVQVQGHMETFLPRQFDHRVDVREYLNKAQYPPQMYQTPVAIQPPNPPIHHHGHRDEEISTIFVVGFPDDMHEREFQNMFTFSKGFEAASLKIPQKESQSNSSPYSQDQQGHVSGQWSHDDNFGPSISNTGAAPHPRKQIIGFAKFKSRGEALEARDMLQGKKVDPERGSVLKAEMAKKNLHTKRGPGPSGLPLSMVAPGNMVGAETLATLAGLPGGVAALPTQASGEAMRDRERELGTLGAMGFIRGGTQRREREAALGEAKRDPTLSTGSHNRYTSSESDAEAETSRYLRSQNEVAFDAFHAVPAQPYRTPASMARSVLSPTDSFSSLSPQHDHNNFPPSIIGTAAHNVNVWTIGPQTGSSTNGSSPQSDISNFPPSLSGFSLTDSPPLNKHIAAQRQDPDKTMTGDPLREQIHQLGKPISQPPSSSSSVTGSHSSVDGDSDAQPGSSHTQQGSSPPFSTTSFPSNKVNPSDQNPPINTLYVGNLPSASPSSGFGTELEDSLRHLFTQCPGYRKLVYKYKNGNPMCFVEFEDVAYATRALSELYGNQVNGLVKSGIRLSYSKNPLGVRPPASQTGTIGRHPPAWVGDASTPISPAVMSPRPFDQYAPSQPSGPRHHQEMAEPPVARLTQRASAISPTYAGNPYHYFASDSQPDQPTPQSLTSATSTFSPFQNMDLSAMSLNRDSKIPSLTPSPGIEVARAG